jgi:Ca2+/Na+ antiporter
MLIFDLQLSLYDSLVLLLLLILILKLTIFAQQKNWIDENYASHSAAYEFRMSCMSIFPFASLLASTHVTERLGCHGRLEHLEFCE